jgi:hypothetical protein
MSLEMLSAVWELDLPRTEKDVLEVLAWHANADGICWPSKARIMYTKGLSEASVKRAFASLKQKGLIKVEAHAKGGRAKTPIYQLHPEKGLKMIPFEQWKEQHKGAQGESKRGSLRPEKGLTVSPEPTENRQIEPSVSSTGTSVANAPSVPVEASSQKKEVKQENKGKSWIEYLFNQIASRKEHGSDILSPDGGELPKFGKQYKSLLDRDGYTDEDIKTLVEFQLDVAEGKVPDVHRQWKSPRNAAISMKETGYKPSSIASRDKKSQEEIDRKFKELLSRQAAGEYIPDELVEEVLNGKG